MPSGRVHSTATIAASIGLALLPIDDSVIMAVGCLSGVLIHPDWDIDGFVESDGVIRRNVGHLPMLYWRTLLYPYRESIKHRSFWSHTPLVGTMVRLLYLMFPILIGVVKDQDSSGNVRVMSSAVVSQLLAVPFGGMAYLAWMYPASAAWLVGGLVISDALHWVFDQIF